MENINYNIRFNTQNDGKVVAAVSKIEAGVVDVRSEIDKMGNMLPAAIGKINASLGRIRISAVLDQVNRVADGLGSISNPGMQLSSSLYDLQAITGVAGDKLQQIEGYARQAAKTFGGSAADGVEAYKLVLSQLSPEIAKVPAALRDMGKSVNTLSKTMGGDTVAATEVLTTAMNQYQVSTEDPMEASRKMAEMMNVMAAGAKEGSAELPQIKAALEQAGMAAKTANVSFEETNAAIQVLDKAGKKGAEGGVAVRNMLATLSEGRFLPKQTQKALAAYGITATQLANKNITLAERLKILKPIMNDGALVTQLFGKENQNAAIALMSGIPEIERLTAAITGTNVAYEQAAVVMESPAEKAKRLQANVDDLKISLFNGSNGWLGYASVLGDVTRDFTNLYPAVDMVIKSVRFLTNAQKMNAVWQGIVAAATTVWTSAQWLLNAAFWANPITWIVAGVVALIAVIAVVVSKTTGWGEAWKHTVSGSKLIFQAFVAAVQAYFNTAVNGIMIGLNYIKKGWYEFKSAVGIGDEGENERMIAQIAADTDARKKAIVDGMKQVADLGKKAAVEFKAAGASVKWEDKTKTKPAVGISDPVIPGATGTNKDGKIKGGIANGEGKKANETIATGGTKNTTIHISIGKQIETLTVTAATIKESAQKIGETILDELTRTVAMGASLGNG